MSSDAPKHASTTTTAVTITTTTAAASAPAAKSKANIAEIKNGKVAFRQKPMSFEKMTETMQETVKFRELLEMRREKSEPALDAVPDEFKPLVAKFVQESDKTSAALAKHIQQALAPDTDEDEDEAPTPGISLDAIESCIKSISTRTNYGLDAPPNAPRAAPAAVCVWRWELSSPNHDWLPKASRDKVTARLAERVQAKKDLRDLFDALPQAEQDSLLGVKAGSGNGKARPSQPFNRAASNDPAIVCDLTSPSKPAADADKMVVDGEGENVNGSPVRKAAAGRPKKVIDPEQAAKEQERLERKSAKAEREKKEKESQARSRSIMANFFGSKPKEPPAQTSPAKERAAASTASAVASSSKTVSDYEKTFKPFVLKKDTVLAPANAFRAAGRGRRRRGTRLDREVIVIDDEEPSGNMDVDAAVQLVDVLSPAYQPSPVSGAAPSVIVAPRPIDGFKSFHPEPVRAAMSRLTEAEVSGDTAAVATLLSDLADRKKYPAKALIFHEDARPGYFGSFTRRSRVVGPRAPLARDDVCVDYSYDSGEDWEQEEDAGEDVAEGSEGDGEDDAGSDEDDMDGWLVDDEDEDVVVTPIEERGGFDLGVPPLPPLPDPRGGKRKAIEVKEEAGEDGNSRAKKRKAVVPLVPFAKGPCWETEIGRCEYEPFKQYTIQFFNDAHCSIDPFTFVSQPVDLSKPVPTPAGPAQTTQLSVPTGQPPFAVPALPPHLTAGETKKAKIIVPKSPFPDAHIQYLCDKVAQMQTGSLPVLVDAVYQDLREHKVKKNAIEAKIREICAKGTRGSAWAVKGDLPSLPVKTEA